ncbi:alpha/beta fold hydrolase [Streptomyces sp. NPDC017936]|uniref:alpha/beta fold hydrolase n=1 Tax=Streptomyces sp. NPDC017936 TaxID=3365016 RepID=UPI0037A923B5
MSQLLTATLPDAVDRTSLQTGRGPFACLEAHPPHDERKGAVLLLPGLTGSKEDFAPLLPPLAAAGYRAVAVDGRGQYETDGPSSPAAYTPAELAADVIALTATLGDEPVHLVGHSFGGFVAREAVLRAAASEPAMPWASLTLLNSGPSAPSTGQRRRAQLLIDALASLPKDDIWSYVRPAQACRDAEALMRERWARTTAQSLVSAARWLLDPPSGISDLAACGIPVLVLAGEPDDSWSASELDAMAVQLKAERLTIPSGGHSPGIHAPRATAEALAEFWAGRGRSRPQTR